ncbi:hypothetical protein [Streptomyces sp. NPDC056105]|uniref:hypothetical protein n=1 Tax=Streptomyces sp. NPDC056105 TaxID=3345714 RepID=UPI0035D56BE9
MCEAVLRQTRLKNLMARRADRVYVLAHGVKLGRAPFHVWAKLRQQWTLVTDASAHDAQIRVFEASGVRVEVAPPAGE